MSSQAQDQIKTITNLIGSIGIAACAVIFYDVRSDMKKMAADIVDLREKVARIEGQTKR